MKKQITVLFAWALALSSFAQTTFTLDLVAEGNFGSTNGDVFRRNTTVTPSTTSTGVYQGANSSSGFNVLQDFVVFGDKAIIAEKPAGVGRVVIADYPSLNEVHTFNTSDAPQTLKFVSATKAYVSMGNPSDLRLIDLANNTMTSVIDPSNAIYSYTNHMEYANGILYVVMGSSIAKVDTITNTVTGTISPSVGSIKGLVHDQVDDKLWVLNSSGELKSIDIANNDALGTSINTGVSSSKLLRIYNQKLYFWSSNKNMYIYDINGTPSLPLSASFTSTLPGASYSFAYGRSFDIDTTTGDFVICSANTFSAPGHYQVVDGDAFTIIETGNIPGCAIPNKCILKTFDPVVQPIPDVDSLPVITAECFVELTPPTANSGSISATTTDPISYSSQGSFNVTWEFSNGTSNVTQTQTVVISDITAPVPTVNVLDTVKVECNEEITFNPIALDNCSDTVFASTTHPLSYSSDGTYTIEWTYDDGNGNSISQNQIVVVECNETNTEEYQNDAFVLYPNPVRSVLNIRLNNHTITEGYILTTTGQKVQHFNINNKGTHTLDVSTLSSGMYIVLCSDLKGNKYQKRIVVQ